MKILKKDSGLLANYEVQRVIAEDAALLETSPSSSSGRITKEEELARDRRSHFSSAMQKYFDRCYPKMKKLKPTAVEAFVANIQRYQLEEDEVVQLMNLMPVEPMFIYGICQDCDERYCDEQIESMINLVRRHLINGDDNRDPPPAEVQREASKKEDANAVIISTTDGKEDTNFMIKAVNGEDEDEVEKEDDKPLAMIAKTDNLTEEDEKSLAMIAKRENSHDETRGLSPGAAAASNGHEEVKEELSSNAEPRLRKAKRKLAIQRATDEENVVRAKRPVREKRRHPEPDAEAGKRLRRARVVAEDET